MTFSRYLAVLPSILCQQEAVLVQMENTMTKPQLMNQCCTTLLLVQDTLCKPAFSAQDACHLQPPAPGDLSTSGQRRLAGRDEALPGQGP